MLFPLIATLAPLSRGGSWSKKSPASALATGTSAALTYRKAGSPGCRSPQSGDVGLVSVPHRIFSWVKEQPEAPAIIGQDSLSYRQLWTEASSWAYAVAPHLQDARDVVGTLRNRGRRRGRCELAAWIAGVGYIPLDPDRCQPGESRPSCAKPTALS